MAFSLVLSSCFLLLITESAPSSTKRTSSTPKNPKAFESSSSTLCCGISLLLFGVTFRLCRHDSGTFDSSIILTPLFLFSPFFSRLSWVENSGVGFSLDYPNISLHAVSRDLSAFPWEHLYVMVNANFEGTRPTQGSKQRRPVLQMGAICVLNQFN